MEVAEGQGQQKVEAYPDKLTEPEKVKPVAMDMHEAFRQAIQMCLSHARVVADKFHLIKHVYYCYPELKEARIFEESFRTLYRETDRSRAVEMSLYEGNSDIVQERTEEIGGVKSSGGRGKMSGREAAGVLEISPHQRRKFLAAYRKEGTAD